MPRHDDYRCVQRFLLALGFGVVAGLLDHRFAGVADESAAEVVERGPDVLATPPPQFCHVAAEDDCRLVGGEQNGCGGVFVRHQSFSLVSVSITVTNSVPGTVTVFASRYPCRP